MESDCSAAEGECCIPMLGLIQCMYIYMYIYIYPFCYVYIQHTAPQEPRQNPAVKEVFSNDFDGLAFFLGVMYLAPGGRSKKTRF